MKAFLHKLATILCVIGIVLFSMILIGNDKNGVLAILPGTIVMDGLFIFFLYLLHRKKQDKSERKFQQIKTRKETRTAKISSAQNRSTNMPTSSTGSPKKEMTTLPTISENAGEEAEIRFYPSIIPYENLDINSSNIADKISKISKEIVSLLWFENGPLQNYSSDDRTYEYEFIKITFKGSEEPSAIDISLPISATCSEATPLNYYPSYRELMPDQRAAYFNWLCDISSPINIGYVFIFYYGLERHLFFGDGEAALDVIMRLREFHNHGSFLAYSESAIALYAILHRKYDTLIKIGNSSRDSKLQLFTEAIAKSTLSPQRIIAMYNAFDFKNTNYIKREPELFHATLKGLLIDRYNLSEYPIFQNDFQTATATFSIMLANYSLMPEQRYFELPDISTSRRVHDEINNLLVETHETVKGILKERRKKIKPDS